MPRLVQTLTYIKLLTARAYELLHILIDPHYEGALRRTQYEMIGQERTDWLGLVYTKPIHYSFRYSSPMI